MLDVETLEEVENEVLDVDVDEVLDDVLEVELEVDDVDVVYSVSES